MIITTTKITVNGKHRIIRTVLEHTDLDFEGIYKGADIEINWDEQLERYSILVRNPEISFGTLYDGYAPDHIHNIDDAIREALIGSGLVGEV